MSDNDDFKLEWWVYTGLRMNDGKLSAIWQRLDDHTERVFNKNKNTDAIIGGMYQIPTKTTDDGVTVRFSEAKYEHPFSDSGTVNQWRVEHRQAEAIQASRNLSKKMEKESRDIGQLTLDEIASMMRTRIGYRNRAALLALVMEYIA